MPDENARDLRQLPTELRMQEQCDDSFVASTPLDDYALLESTMSCLEVVQIRMTTEAIKQKGRSSCSRFRTSTTNNPHVAHLGKGWHPRT